MGARTHVGRNRDREVIRERQRPEHAILRTEAEHGVGRVDARQDIRVREHHALPIGRRPRRKADERCVDRVESAGGGPIAIDPGENGSFVGEANDAVHVGFVEHGRDFGRAKRRRDRHETRACREHAERRRHVAEDVVGDQPDAVSPPDAVEAKPVGRARDLRRERRIVERAPGREVGERGPGSVARRARGEHVGQRHRARSAASRPTASPTARQVPMTRAEPIASCDALMHRPAASRFVHVACSTQPRGTSYQSSSGRYS